MKKSNQGELLLNFAKYEDDLVTFKEMIRNGAKINTINEAGETALHIATEYKNNNIVCALIELKADLNIKDSLGNTALHYAVMTKNKIAAKALIEVGANPNIKNNDNKTALKIAQEAKDPKIVSILLPNITRKLKPTDKNTLLLKW